MNETITESESTLCTCKGINEAIMQGVREMESSNPPAPQTAIIDYVSDMTYGDWIHCSCEASQEK